MVRIVCATFLLVAIIATLSANGPGTSLGEPAGSRGGAENVGLENRLESDELRLKQPQISSTINVSELSQNCLGLIVKILQ